MFDLIVNINLDYLKKTVHNLFTTRKFNTRKCCVKQVL